MRMQLGDDVSEGAVRTYHLCESLLPAFDNFLLLLVVRVVAIDNPFPLQVIQKIKDVVLTVIPRVFIVDRRLSRCLFD